MLRRCLGEHRGQGLAVGGRGVVPQQRATDMQHPIGSSGPELGRDIHLGRTEQHRGNPGVERLGHLPTSGQALTGDRLERLAVVFHQHPDMPFARHTGAVPLHRCGLLGATDEPVDAACAVGGILGPSPSPLGLVDPNLADEGR